MLTDDTGYIAFLSTTYEGKASDKRIVDESGYTLPDGSTLYQDTGFQGFMLPGVCIIQPKKKPRGGVLTPEEKAENRRISSIRIFVEHVIGDIKRYRIVKDVLRSRCDYFWDKVMETCCGLHNFRVWYKISNEVLL